MYPKSASKLEFLKACWYSPKNNGCSLTNNLFVIVKFLSSLIAQKYGIDTPDPKFFVSENDGGKKPDLLSTVGSG